MFSGRTWQKYNVHEHRRTTESAEAIPRHPPGGRTLDISGQSAALAQRSMENRVHEFKEVSNLQHLSVFIVISFM